MTMSFLRRFWSRERGFTIVELMVGVFIGGILMAIALPTIQNHVAVQQLRGRAREVSDVLRGARNLAMDEGVPRYVLFSPPSSYQLYRFERSAWVADRSVVELEGVSFTAADLTFPAITPVADCGNPPASVPLGAAYFDTRGRYPVDLTPGTPPACPTYTGQYTIALHGRLGKTRTITLHAQTGQVTGA